MSWKFDVILAGKRDADMLDTYKSERDALVRAVIVKGIELGRVQTMRDPVAAAARDADLIARRAARAKPEKIRFPPLGEGAFHGGEGAHELMIQGFGERGGRRDRFDALFGYGPMILAREDAAAAIDGRRRGALAEAGITLAVIADTGADPDALRDTDGTYRAWFDAHRCSVAAVRPDFHVWGTAGGETNAIDALVDAFIAFVEGQGASRAVGERVTA